MSYRHITKNFRGRCVASIFSILKYSINTISDTVSLLKCGLFGVEVGKGGETLNLCVANQESLFYCVIKMYVMYYILLQR